MLTWIRVAAVLCLSHGPLVYACDELLTSDTTFSFRQGNEDVEVSISKNVHRELSSRRFDQDAREQFMSTLSRCLGPVTDSTHCKRLQRASHILEIRLRGKRFGNYRFYAERVNGRLEVQAFVRQHDRKKDINRVIDEW